MLLVAPGITTSNKQLLVAKGIATSNKDSASHSAKERRGSVLLAREMTVGP